MDYLLGKKILIHVWRGKAKAVGAVTGMKEKDAEVTRTLIESLKYLGIRAAVSIRQD